MAAAPDDSLNDPVFHDDIAGTESEWPFTRSNMDGRLFIEIDEEWKRSVGDRRDSRTGSSVASNTPSEDSGCLSLPSPRTPTEDGVEPQVQLVAEDEQVPGPSTFTSEEQPKKRGLFDYLPFHNLPKPAHTGYESDGSASNDEDAILEASSTRSEYGSDTASPQSISSPVSPDKGADSEVSADPSSTVDGYEGDEEESDDEGSSDEVSISSSTEHDSADSPEEAEAEDLLVKCIFPNCKKTVVASNEAMSEHIKGVHFEGVRHTAFVACPVDGCDFNPAAVERVTEHICSVKHSAAFGGVDLRPQCDHCGNYFARKSSKTRHRSSDSGGCKVCRFCDRTFESNAQRWAHESGSGAKGCKAVSAAVRKEVKEAEEARLQALSDRRQTRKAENDNVAPARKKRRIQE